MANLSCLIGADAFGDPNAPIAFPGNFTDEFFYYNMGSALTLQGTHKAKLIIALEGAFLNGPVVPGDQMVFARVRLVIDAPVEGHYIIDHPYGRDEFDVTAPGPRAIFFTHDVGLTAQLFSGALAGDITTFVRAAKTDAAGNAILGADGKPVAADPVQLAGGNFFLADPNVLVPVTDGPNGHSFTITGPAGSNMDGAGNDSVTTTTFNVMGKVHRNPIPAEINVTRATYQASGTSNRIDVFVDTLRAITGPNSKGPSPVLSLSGAGINTIQLSHDGDKYYGHTSLSSGETTVPKQVTLTNAADGTTQTVDLVDEVNITTASYDPNSQVLKVNAKSGDSGATLTLLGLGAGPQQLTQGTLQTFTTAAPPGQVIVVSSAHGRNSRNVQLTVAPPSANLIAANDDFSGTPIAQGAATLLALSGNDTVQNVADATLTKIQIVSQPANGTISAIDAPQGSVTYTPNANFSGTDTFKYQLVNGTDVSNIATVTVAMAAAANHAPVAGNDAATAGANQSVTVRVLDNDADPDFGDSLNAASVAIVAGSVVSPGNVNVAFTMNADGTITFTPPVAGNYLFQYTVNDSHGLTSNAATVTVTALAGDSFSNLDARFTTSKGDWRVRGNTAIAGPGNTVTIYIGSTITPTSKVLGTINVDNTGTFDFVLKGTSIKPDATNQISLKSSRGAQQFGFQVKVQ
jgi:hypothetical protein